MFVSTERVPVSDGTNTIYIKPKMDFGTRNRVMDEIARIGGLTNGTAGEVGIQIGAYNTALMIYNVVAWDGPDFEGVHCTPETIRALDPDEPLVDLVLAEIAKRNPLGGRDPKGSGASTRNGAPTVKATASRSKATTSR